MTTITYIDFEGVERKVEANAGDTIMETAVDNDIPGIDGDCGGGCACATCHVYVDEEFIGKLAPRSDAEESMLEFAEDVKDNSRLSCQIIVSDQLDGIRITTPENQ